MTWSLLGASLGPPLGQHKLPVVLPKRRCGQARLGTPVNHVQCASADFFNVAGQKQRLGHARVAGNGRVRAAQVVHR
jgi:hypothetical protein